MDILQQVLVLFFLIVIGYAGRKARFLDDAAVAHFSSFILNITLPALILVSLQKPFSMALLSEAAAIFGVSIAFYAFSFLFAFFYPVLLRLGTKQRGVHRYAVIFSNVGFMGYPVVEAFLGSEALFHLAIFNIPFNFLAFSVGAWLISREGSKPLRLSWRTFVNPSVGATLLGFIFFLASVRLPLPLFNALKMTGDITSPLSMIVIGTILARMDPRKVFGRFPVYITVVVRLAILPACIGFLLYAAGFRALLFALPVLMTAMPVAANTSILASVYEADVEEASSLVFLSTLLCIVSIPLVAIFLS